MQKDLFKKMGPPLPLSASMPKKSFNGEMTALSWSEFFDTCEDIRVESRKATFRVHRIGKEKGDEGALTFILLHGAGHTSLSWALCAKEMADANCQVFAFDCRAHGSTTSDDEEDLSVEVLTEDATSLIEQCFNETKNQIVIVGHSMGGAIAARVAASGRVPRLVATIVIDVVEALAALPGMHRILEARPQHFPTLEDAINWSIYSGMLKKSESARVSIPSQLVPSNGLTWRTRLEKTEPFWKGWFTDLSKTFLSVKGHRVLILAGTDRLDKELTIAHMQGRFQLILFPTCGHTIQEDDPQRTAQALLQLQTKNKW
ncbi:hypothetical protein PROFUN_00192 [Planoprotostelium fungivorum]|uniref:Protein phosphatase methylesterase 1 n=1 Tax=Planoprotostelium fungivorum TaxID=1890364 RepID=A0A2P6P0Y2_9EUKA|nr:hypothetical protein PROFUN_00192 [Planoprotostelium fungivorum]